MPEEKKTNAFGELDCAFIDRYLRHENESLEEAKARILKEQTEIQTRNKSES